MFGARMPGTQKLTCEMTLRDGRIVYELNGLSRPNWNTLPKGYRATGDRALGVESRPRQLGRSEPDSCPRCQP